MIKAVYIQREDGDWDFIVGFSTEYPKCEQWLADIVEYFDCTETCRVFEFSGNGCPDVLEFDTDQA